MSYFAKVEHCFLPIPEDERIVTAPFLLACRHGILPFLDVMGTAFSPVKSDVSGNIEKLQKKYDTNPEKFTTINDMLEEEVASKSSDLAIVAGLWLKRGLEFIRLQLQLIIDDHNSGTKTENLGINVRMAYEKTLKQYHGWLTQKLFSVVSRALPNRTNFIKTLNNGEEGGDDQVIADMAGFLKMLNLNVEVLIKLFKDMGLDDDKKV